jgi:diacylglycerol kinase family enzyme
MGDAAGGRVEQRRQCDRAHIIALVLPFRWCGGSRAVIVATMSTAHATVALVGNPSASRGSGPRIGAQVLSRLNEEGLRHDFGVLDLTGRSYEDSLAQVRARRDDFGFLVVAGGDGMVSLGLNAAASDGVPLGIVPMGSGNDFARGLGMPVNRMNDAVHDIVASIVAGSRRKVDMGVIRFVAGGASDSDGELLESTRDSSARYFAGMLSCGLDASINDRANHSRLPIGPMRYFAATLREVIHLQQYGYHIRAVLPNGNTDERTIVTPLLAVANSRHVGGGIELSPKSEFDDGLLDLVWLNRMPSPAQIVNALSKAYNGTLFTTGLFGWQRVRAIHIEGSSQGVEPPALMADGEYAGHLPVTVTVRPQGLNLLVPAKA